MATTFPFSMQKQTQTNWCWAAVSTSVSLYYQHSSQWTQCKVANAQLGSSTCCVSPGPCNVYGYLDRALTTVGCYNSTYPGAYPFNQVNVEMQHKRPLGIRVAWSGGGAHFIATHGTNQIGTAQLLYISDSIYGESVWNIATPYQGSGRWTTSYLTKAPAARQPEIG